MATWLDASWKSDAEKKMPESWADINSCRYICFWSYVVGVCWTYDTLLKQYLTEKKHSLLTGKNDLSFSTDIKQHSVSNLINQDMKVTITDQRSF